MVRQLIKKIRTYVSGPGSSNKNTKGRALDIKDLIKGSSISKLK
jgi:hypothetical protein